ncbi:MAG TPA: PA14 domain-containing protein, partial [Gemmataceae bacterium]|nr:PA14 domain-containing protein [Gemmataceae bacterium]
MTALSFFRSAITRVFGPQVRTPRKRRLALTQMEGRDMPSVGGGITAGGLFGEYFDNPNLSGSPAFTRRDVRIDFDWGYGSAAGSNSPGFSRVGNDNFSARWTGQVVPRFSENYTFKAGSDDGVRVWIKQAGTGNWINLVDNWGVHGFEERSRSYPLTAGQTYDIKVEYFESAGPAGARLTWASPSTPEEVIDPVTDVGLNVSAYADHLFADATKMARSEWGHPTDYFNRPLVALDGDGWPTADASKIFFEGQDPDRSAGTYRLRFQGKADVRAKAGAAKFRVGNRDHGASLPAGAGYDPSTNTTTADVVVKEASLLLLSFRDTQRNQAAKKNTGITNVQLLRPDSPGSGTSYQPDEVFDRATKEAFSRFSVLRFLSANFNAERDWWERKQPSDAKAAFADRAGVWEYQVMLANETGKDLYITIPINASDDYVQKLAKLIRYGSDGSNPYDWANPDPKYPGLNPNLRVYVEWGNEVWNWAFDQAKVGSDAGKAAVQAGTPDGKIVNYDGERPDGDFRRWTAVRTVRASNTFRSVFGDAAMGETVRMLLEYQYDNHQGTAVEALQFIDNYFNNGDGKWHVADPKPVSHYLWGAGGATYFGAGNPRGLTDEIKVWDGSVENVPVAAGGSVKRPGGSAWQFTGDAGVFRDHGWAADNQAMSVNGIGPIAATTAGAQAMYISGGGSATVSIDFPRAGWYALDFLGAVEPAPEQPPPGKPAEQPA